MNLPTEFSHGSPDEDYSLVQDKIISTRLKSYINGYYGRYITNCSTLARFLFDSNFAECSKSNGHFTFDRDFTIYTGQEIVIGNVMLFMFNKLMAKSGSSDLTKHFMLLTRNMLFPEDNNGRLSSDQMQAVYKRNYHNYHFDDFHLMTCIGVRDDETAFISQTGMSYPGDDKRNRPGTRGRIITHFERPMSFLELPVIPLLLTGRTD